MIPLSRQVVLVLLALLSLVGIPMAFVGSPTTLDNPAVWVPIFVVGELVLYFLLSLATNPRLTLGATAMLSIMMAVARLAASLVALALLTLVFAREVGPLMVWASDPVSVILQVVVLIVTTPHLLDAASPGLVDRETRRKLSGGERELPVARMPSTEAMPTGGFIQVFGFEELAATIRKTPGLEGFLIFSSEGLIVWRDLPLRVDADRLTAKLMALSRETAVVVNESGLARVRQVVIESREHLVAVVELTANFGLILVYNGQVNVGECAPRIAILAKTTREFLQWKYPGLAITASPQTRAALEAV